MTWDLTKASDVTLCAMALEIWADWIQFDTPVPCGEPVRDLNDSQKAHVRRIRNLAQELKKSEC